MRLFTFFFLLSSALGAVLPLPAFAAQEKKELTEEEEIAQMMEQLEQFKASWESKDQSGQASAPAAEPSEQAPAAKPNAESKPAGTTPSAIPTIKITSAIAPAAGPVQIKTQDGRILGAAAPAAVVKPEIKTPAAVTPPLINQPVAFKLPAENNSVSKKPEGIPPQLVKPEAQPKPEVREAPVAAEKKLEQAVPATEPAVINQELIKKLNLPTGHAKAASIETPKQPIEPKAAPSKEVKLAAKPADPVKPEIKVAALPMVVSQEKVEEKTPVKDSQVKKEEPAQKQVVPEKPAVLPVESPNKIEMPVVKQAAAAAPVEKIAVPAATQAPVKVDSIAAPAAAQSADEIVIVQDEAAQYRAVREKAELKSARETQQTLGKPEIQDESVRVVDSDEAKTIGRRPGVSLPNDPRSQTRSKWAAARAKGAAPVKAEPPKPNLFADTFYLTPEQRLAYDVYDIDGFIFVKSPNPDLNTKYAVVTGFGGGAMKTRSIPNLQKLEDAKKWVSDNLKTEKFEGVEIKKMSLGVAGGSAKDLYWVGQKAYPDYKTAQQEVAVVQSVVTEQGGDFGQLVSEASTYAPMTDGAQGIEIKGPANFEREEELMLKYADQLDLGRKLFGPFQGDASGESFTWQSFGETTWRKTNLDRTDYRSQVGYWTNRVVFKGIRFPLNTVEPFLEDTISLDSTSADFSSNMKLFAGLEWRPFARNAWLYNYRPWGGISVLEWIKNFRFYMMYGERKAIKDPIEGSADTDLLAGVQIFYEWGVELPPLDQREPKAFSDFVEQYFWGEYFGDYRHEMTNFGSEDDYNSWLGNSSVTMGVKLPGIPLPDNPINEELMLMPYMRFEHVNSAEFSFPYQNQYFVAAGMRWMPWRNYRYKENEWLSKAKFFGEFVGVGLSQHAKQDEEAPNAVRYDLRFGVSFSSRRY